MRYVILHHVGIDHPHYDLMFETAPGSALATWRSDHWPIKDCVTVEKLADHRREYLTFEGPLSGNRGRVVRVEAGECEIAVSDNSWVITATDFELRLIAESNGTWRCEKCP
jgi:hypothetical protein